MRVTNKQRQTLAGVNDLPIFLAFLVGLIGLVSLPSTTWASTSPSLALSDKRLCADLKCEQIISMGIAKITYIAGGEGLLSLKINAPVRILSKSAGKNPKMWGIETGGRRGYVNKDFIMEQRIVVKDEDLKFEVDVVGPGSPKPVLPPVEPALNASETIEDLLTTTTSPLDLKADAIVTEQSKTSRESGEAAAPEPSKPNVQVVDGTQLPLEALPDVTETTEGSNPGDSLPIPVEVTKTDDSLPDITKTKESLPVITQNNEETKIKESSPVTTEKVKETETSATETLKEITESLPSVTENVNKTEKINVEEGHDLQYGDLSDDYDYEEDDEEAIELENDINKKDEFLDNKKPIENIQLEINITDKIVDKNIDNNIESEVPQVKTENKTEKLPIATATTETSTTETITETTISEKAKTDENVAILNSKTTEKVEPQKVKQEEAIASKLAEQGNQIEADVWPEEIKVDLNVTQGELIEANVPVQTLVTSNEVDPGLIILSNEAEKKTDSHASEQLPIQTVSSTPEPLVEDVPVSLPPLFNKQNPNDYYKQMQEQQLRLEQERQTTPSPYEAIKVKDAAPPIVANDENITSNKNEISTEQTPEQYTTPSPSFDSPYDAFYNEPTPAPTIVVKDENPVSSETRASSEQIENLSPAKPEDIPRPVEQDMTNPEYVKETDQGIPIPRDETVAPSSKDFDEPSTASTATPQSNGVGSVESVSLPSMPPSSELVKESAGLGLFATIVDTVNSFISSQGGPKEPDTVALSGGDELHRILYSSGGEPTASKGKGSPGVAADGYCSRNVNCPSATVTDSSLTLENFIKVFALKVLEQSQLLLCVVIAAISSLFFVFMYYCCCNSSQEGALLAKLNQLERSLLASHKENAIIKHDLMTTRQKLASIEDNSFGSNDMVASLKKQLETELYEKAKLQEQVGSLERDLDNAAEAGLELNRMLSEVLNSQNGDEAFINTVDELQRQLNDQEKIIIDINSSLAEKSRENSELQYSYTESTARLTSEMSSLQQENYELEMEKAKLQTSLDGIKAESEKELAKSLEARFYEMQKLQNQILELNAKWEKEHNDLQTSYAKIDALEDCLKAVKKDANLNVQELITSAKTKGELNAAQKKFLSLQSKLEQEAADKARLEQQLQQSGLDVEQLKQDYNQSERDKLEAQTRLEVLSGYFREKETQLQKELSLQEAKWLQHQGETSSTVETQTLMKNEIQLLKSQNDELRAEIEAQIASHKAQMGTLENRAHESWLAARQSERRCEEALTESAGLRRKLTAMASGRAGGGEGDSEIIASSNGGNDGTAPSPLPLVAPGSPLLNMPNPLPFLPAPFPPFLGLPPPFLPPTAGGGGARPPPLGRMRSPPPSGRDRDHDRDRDRDRYSDYSDYDDYDEEEDERSSDHRRRHSGSWGRGSGGYRRDSFVHSPRTYRSLSPSDSRYNYNDTETDFSPPPSPPLRTRHRLGGGGGGGSGSGGGGSRPITDV